MGKVKKTQKTSALSNISDFFSNDKRNIWLIYIVFLLFNVALAVQYRAPFAYPDEYGVFTAGNWMFGGEDWAYKSNMYYGYTFSPFAGLMMFLFDGIRPIYIGSLCIKAMQVSLIPVFCYKLLHEVLKMEDTRAKILLSVSVSLYPSLALYSKYVSNETTLHVSLFIIFYLIGKLSVEQSKNKIRLYSVLLGFFPALTYASHGMGLAFIVAVCLIIPVAHIGTKKRLVSYPFFIGSLASFYLLDSKLKDMVMAAVNYTPERGLTNTFSYAFNNLIAKILNPEFILSFFNMFASRLLYISSSTFGIFLLALVILLVFLFRFAKARFSKNSEPQNNALFVVEIFSVIVFLCGIGLSSIHNTPNDMSTASRMYFYGRYYEYTALPLILTGLHRLFTRDIKKMELLKYFIVSFACYVFLYFYSHFFVMPNVSQSLNRFFILGILPFISKSKADVLETSSQNTLYFDLFSLGIVTILVFMVLIYLLKGKLKPLALVFLSSMFIYGTVYGHTSAVLPLSVANYNNFYSNMEPIEAALSEFRDVYKQFPKLYVVSNRLGASTSSSTLLRGRAQLSFINYSVSHVMMANDLEKVANSESLFNNSIIVSERDLEVLNTDEAYFKIHESPNARIWIRGEEINAYYADR